MSIGLHGSRSGRVGLPWLLLLLQKAELVIPLASAFQPGCCYIPFKEARGVLWRGGEHD